MKASKRLKIAIAEIAAHAKDKPKIRLIDWIKDQPWSTRKGIERGNFVLPSYVRG